MRWPRQQRDERSSAAKSIIKAETTLGPTPDRGSLLPRTSENSVMKLSEKGLSNAPKVDSAGISGPKWAE
jgi:hypothetical protein